MIENLFQNCQNFINHLDINETFHRFTREAYLKPFDETRQMFRSHDKIEMQMTFEHQAKKTTIHRPLNDEMKRIEISQLKLGQVHQGYYLPLKIIREPLKFTSIMVMAEDITGEVIRVAIYNYKAVFPISSYDDADYIFSRGKWIIVLEPFYKLSQDNFDQIRADNPKDILLFDNEVSMNNYIDKIQSMEQEKVIGKGNECMKEKKYSEAIDYYKRILKKNMKDVVVNSYMAEAYLNLEYYSKANIYANFALKELPNDPHLLLKKCKALIGLNKNKEAFNIATSPSLASLREVEDLVKTLKRKMDNNNGFYNFFEMSRKEKADFYLDYGDYLNEKISLSYDKERGVKVITNNIIQPGELILGTKALAAVRLPGFPEDITHEKLKMILSDKLNKAPFDHEVFYQLFDGNNKSLDLNERKEKRDYSYDKINNVIGRNSFLTQTMLNTSLKAHGLWGLPSFLNHSCISNCSICNLGDFMFIVSNQEIKQNEELTINYISFEIPYRKRKSSLLEGWGIQCTCELCIYEENKLQTSPQKSQLLAYQEEINKYISLKPDDPNIKLNDLEHFPIFLEENKKIFSCYEMGIAYNLYGSLISKSNNDLGLKMQMKALHYAQNRNSRLERFVLFEIGKIYYKTGNMIAFQETKNQLKVLLIKYVTHDENYIEEVINEAYEL